MNRKRTRKKSLINERMNSEKKDKEMKKKTCGLLIFD